MARRLAEEHETSVAALTWARSTPHEDDMVLRTSGRWRFWFIRGHLSEGRLWLGRALEHPAEPSAALGRALFGASTLAVAAGGRDGPRTRCRPARGVPQLGSDGGSLAVRSEPLANITAGLGRYEEAVALYDRAATRAEAAGADPRSHSIANNSGYLSLLKGDDAIAVDLLRPSRRASSTGSASAPKPRART